MKSADPVTGLSPEYADYDGKTVLLFRKPWVYYSDAYHVAENIALDHVWFGDHPEEEHRKKFLKNFAETPLRKGARRYYDNCLYFFCLLMLTGNYRIY